MIKQHKVVSALPAPLEADSVYFVRVGSGFDVVVTNGAGTIVPYELNAKTALAQKAASGVNADITSLTALNSILALPLGLSFNANTKIYPESNGMKIQLGSPTAATGYITIKSTGELVLESAGLTVGGSILPKTATMLLGNGSFPWSQAYVKTLMMSGPINHAIPVTAASAATVNIGSAASQTVNITGTTTITGFDVIAAGVRRRLVFGGALTLTHGPSSLILPGYANITTAAGDTAEFESLGGGNWRCLSYTRASGRAIAVGAPIPVVVAANNVNVYASGAPVVSVTGVTGIGYLGTGVEGQEVTVVFTDATPVYHSASLVLPGSSSVTTAAGDIAKFVFMGASGVTRCVSYLRAAIPPDSFGYKQTWVDVTASRVLDATYTNDTGRPIQVSCLVGPTSGTLTVPVLYVNGGSISGAYSGVANNYVPSVTAVVPPGATYRLTVFNGTAPIYNFRELR